MRIACPHCDAVFNASSRLAGRPLDCSKCGRAFLMPDKDTPLTLSPPPPPPPASIPLPMEATPSVRHKVSFDDVAPYAPEPRPSRRPARNDDDGDNPPRRRRPRRRDDRRPAAAPDRTGWIVSGVVGVAVLILVLVTVVSKRKPAGADAGAAKAVNAKLAPLRGWKEVDLKSVALCMPEDAATQKNYRQSSWEEKQYVKLKIVASEDWAGALNLDTTGKYDNKPDFLQARFRAYCLETEVDWDGDSDEQLIQEANALLNIFETVSDSHVRAGVAPATVDGRRAVEVRHTRSDTFEITTSGRGFGLTRSRSKTTEQHQWKSVCRIVPMGKKVILLQIRHYDDILTAELERHFFESVKIK